MKTPTANRDEEIFAAALARPEYERAAFVDDSCNGDAAMRARILSLLAAHAGPESLLHGSAPPREILHEEKSGDAISHYKLLQKIGEGGCGVVWMAEQEEPVRRRVALKIIKLGMDTKAVVARFEAERQALAMMDHPNIAKVHDAGSTETGRPYFVMELVRGIPITKYSGENHLTPKERLELFIKVCQAIQHAHQKGVIHRDIKPSNILVTVNDGAPTPKVIDFGIAKATQGRLTDATVFTAFEQFIGTPVYMSPEQAEMSSLDIDTRSDIYSLGVLLYELLTGRPPFDPKVFAQAGVDQIRQRIREVEPPRPSARLRTLDDEERTTVARLRRTAPMQLSLLLRGDLDWIVMRCLEKDRTRRYQTAHALAADVQRHLSHKPVVARPPSAAYRLRKFARRHRAGLIAAGFGVTALVAGALLSRWHAIQSMEERMAIRNAMAPTASLAVLAFANLGGNRDTEYFSDGISDELLNILAKVPGLRVAARTSAFSFRGRNDTVQEIGQKLGVAYVVDGTVRQAGDAVRVTVRLSRTSNGEQIWSKIYPRELNDIFAVQDEIAGSIVAQLRAILPGTSADSDEIRAEIRAATRGRTQNADAYALFLRARFQLLSEEPSAIQETIRLLKQAVVLDPSYALAWVELSNAHRNLASLHGIPSFDEGFRRARETAERALQMEPDLVEALSARMLIRIQHDYDWPSARRDKTRVLELAPNNVGALTAGALLSIALGKAHEAERLARRAVNVDPLSVEARGYFVTSLTLAGKWSEAQVEARRSNELGVKSLLAQFWGLVTPALLEGREDEALRISSGMMEYVHLTTLGIAHHAKGNRPEADAALEALIAKCGKIAAYQVVMVHAMRGEVDDAFVWLERAREIRDTGLPFVQLDPFLKNLRSDPRYPAFLSRMRLAE